MIKKKSLKNKKTTTSNSIKHGYRSGLEDKASQQIAEAGLVVAYELEHINYNIPARPSRYTPDFKLPKKGGFFFIETKGRFLVADRHKHLLIKEQHPDLDIRFVFSNAKAKIYKGSRTSYSDWCDKHGFVWANKHIPTEWLQEAMESSYVHNINSSEPHGLP